MRFFKISGWLRSLKFFLGGGRGPGAKVAGRFRMAGRGELVLGEREQAGDALVVRLHLRREPAEPGTRRRQHRAEKQNVVRAPQRT